MSYIAKIKQGSLISKYDTPFRAKTGICLGMVIAFFIEVLARELTIHIFDQRSMEKMFSSEYFFYKACRGQLLYEHMAMNAQRGVSDLGSVFGFFKMALAYHDCAAKHEWYVTSSNNNLFDLQEPCFRLSCLRLNNGFGGRYHLQYHQVGYIWTPDYAAFIEPNVGIFIGKNKEALDNLLNKEMESDGVLSYFKTRVAKKFVRAPGQIVKGTMILDSAVHNDYIKLDGKYGGVSLLEARL